MGTDMSATVLVGWEVHRDVLFKTTSKMVTIKSCDHPNPHNLKHCGECGKEHKTKTRESTTEQLRPQFLALFSEEYDEEELATWGVFDCGELFQGWEGPNGVGIHERHSNCETFETYVWGLPVTSWDPKYETFADSFSFGDLEAKRMLVGEAFEKLGLLVPLNEIKLHVWGDMY